MQDVKSGAIDCIVVKDLSRFGRNYLETGNYLERIFPFAGVRFIAIADHLDTLEYGMADGYLAPLKNIINEAYSRDISQKASSALAVRQRRGNLSVHGLAMGIVNVHGIRTKSNQTKKRRQW